MTDVGMARGSMRAGRPRRLAGVLAGLVAGAGLSVVPLSGASAAADPGMSVAPMPVTAVPLAQAGELNMWGPLLTGSNGINRGQTTVPASLANVAVSQVVMSDSVTLALTAAGRVVAWGADGARLERVPEAVTAAQVAQVATNGSTYAGVVTSGGQVLTWGTKIAAGSPLDVPAGLSGVKQLALSLFNGVALKNDGSVVAWGQNAVLNAPPPGLTASAIAVSSETVYALKTDGTVTAWGDNTMGELNLPPEVKLAGNVKAVAAYDSGAYALLANGTVVVWGNGLSTTNKTWLSGLNPVSITANGAYLAVVDHDGVIRHRGALISTELSVPAALNGRAVSSFAVGSSYSDGAVVITKMLRGADPAISGASTVGSTLTATPGTFSASPTSVTSQWLVNGSPIPGASGPTLPLTADLVGKAITYKSTATKAGEATVSSTSTAVTVTAAAPPPSVAVASTTKVVKVKVAKKAASVTVTGTVTASKPVTGTAKVTIKKGKKVIVTKSVKVSTKGAVTLKVKKFGKLAIKKTKSKKKNGYRGKYTVTISYAGNSQVKPSSAGKSFNVK